MRISPRMSEAMSPEQEVLIDAASLPFTPAFQCRHLPSLHPYVAVERSPAAMSPLPQPSHWSLGQLPLPTRMQTLLVQRLQAHLQRSDPYAAPSEPAVATTLDAGALSPLSRLLISAHCQGGRGAYPYQLSLVL